MMHSLSIPNLVQIKKKIDLCSYPSTQLQLDHALSVVIILEGKHIRSLALLTVIPLAIDTCRISSSFFVGNPAVYPTNNEELIPHR